MAAGGGRGERRGEGEGGVRDDGEDGMAAGARQWGWGRLCCGQQTHHTGIRPHGHTATQRDAGCEQQLGWRGCGGWGAGWPIRGAGGASVGHLAGGCWWRRELLSCGDPFLCSRVRWYLTLGRVVHVAQRPNLCLLQQPTERPLKRILQPQSTHNPLDRRAGFPPSPSRQNSKRQHP